jgi:hypothetical protein
MSVYYIRYNQTKGQPNRGSVDHVWRVFEDGKEFLCKNIKIDVPSYGAKTGLDFNICCEGKMYIDKETSTITIKAE